MDSSYKMFESGDEIAWAKLEVWLESLIVLRMLLLVLLKLF